MVWGYLPGTPRRLGNKVGKYLLVPVFMGFGSRVIAFKTNCVVRHLQRSPHGQKQALQGSLVGQNTVSSVHVFHTITL